MHWNLFRFETPWALLLLALPVIWAGWCRWRKRQTVPAVEFSSFALVKQVPKTWRMRFSWLPAACLAISWSLLVIGLARPQSGTEQIRNSTDGIAIEMVLDRSGSMRELMEYGGRQLRRLDVVKRIFVDFVKGTPDGRLAGRPNDLIGLIAFASYPYTLCPLTLDHNTLEFVAKGVELAPEGENTTAIGDGVALAVARLKDVENVLGRQNRRNASEYQIRSKIIILLTDGQDEGEHTRSIGEATELAQKYGIKVYSIALVGLPPRGGLFGMLGGEVNYDTSDIEQMAKRTGGKFSKVSTAEELRGIYQEIDHLEKSRVEAYSFVTHHELFSVFVWAGIVFLIVAMLLNVRFGR